MWKTCQISLKNLDRVLIYICYNHICYNYHWHITGWRKYSRLSKNVGAGQPGMMSQETTEIWRPKEKRSQEKRGGHLLKGAYNGLEHQLDE